MPPFYQQARGGGGAGHACRTSARGVVRRGGGPLGGGQPGSELADPLLESCGLAGADRAHGLPCSLRSQGTAPAAPRSTWCESCSGSSARRPPLPSSERSAQTSTVGREIGLQTLRPGERHTTGGIDVHSTAGKANQSLVRARRPAAEALCGFRGHVYSLHRGRSRSHVL